MSQEMLDKVGKWQSCSMPNMPCHGGMSWAWHEQMAGRSA